jgi:hypothetical protein
MASRKLPACTGAPACRRRRVLPTGRTHRGLLGVWLAHLCFCGALQEAERAHVAVTDYERRCHVLYASTSSSTHSLPRKHGAMLCHTFRPQPLIACPGCMCIPAGNWNGGSCCCARWCSCAMPNGSLLGGMGFGGGSGGGYNASSPRHARSHSSNCAAGTAGNEVRQVAC